ncbi:S-adenosylmethionine:tRNA ribosyltransferase-isomerase [Candidatus Magnetomorum sp. HK-1]|nr:S-adenosylmethionine:tRNA ribosyltransferase-isomerase [Candidatus Magnetomorum sp. HK-1]
MVNGLSSVSYHIDNYDYQLPKHLIAQDASMKRDQSRLLVYNRNTKSIEHTVFNKLSDYLQANDLLIVNNTRVIPARLLGKKETGGKIEVFVLDYIRAIQEAEKTGKIQCSCMIKSSKAPRIGSTLYFSSDDQAVVITDPINGRCEIQFLCKSDFLTFLEANGQTPLPPYIQRQAQISDKERYQTIYAKKNGAVAAPTAGLHFTEKLFEKLQKKNINIASITLHVGYGTFMPVRVSDIRKHTMHSEYIEISTHTADLIQKAKKDGQRIIAVGTTSVRTLEYIFKEKGKIEAFSGYCDLFIYPGYSFQVVDSIITNFHLPKSTLMMMISAFAQREQILKVYQNAIDNSYRFFSYGDAMMIV